MTQSLSNITAVVLAGGMGTRLRDAVADRPKILADVNGRPFVSFLLEKLHDSGVRHTVLCTGYMADMVERTLGNRHKGMRLTYSVEAIPLGTGGAVRNAFGFLDSDPVLVMNGDSFFDADLGEFYQVHIKTGNQASILLAEVDNASRYGSVTLTEDGMICRFEEKREGEGPGLINSGIYLLPRKLIQSFPEGKPYSLELDLFPHLSGHGLGGFPQRARFIDIGVPADYLFSFTFFADDSKKGFA